MKRVMLIMLVAFMLVFFAACSDMPADTVDGEEGANEVTEPEGDSAGEEVSEEANGGELTPVTLVLDWTPNTITVVHMLRRRWVILRNRGWMWRSSNRAITSHCSLWPPVRRILVTAIRRK